MQLLGARGAVTAPDFAEPSVKDLDDCRRSVAPYTTGYPLPDGDTLNAQECLALAQLDPFYPTGQWIDPRAVGRGTGAGGTDYGMDPAGTGQDEHQGFGHVIQWSVTNTSARSTSYGATVTDIFGTSYRPGLTLGAKGSGSDADVGFKANVTLKAGSSVASTTSMKITYQNSTATKVQSATSIQDNFDDHNPNLGYRPHVEVYQDLLFGSYMFQDQTSTTACPIFECGPRGVLSFNSRTGTGGTPTRILLNGQANGNSTAVSTGARPALPVPHITGTHSVGTQFAKP